MIRVILGFVSSISLKSLYTWGTSNRLFVVLAFFKNRWACPGRGISDVSAPT